MMVSLVKLAVIILFTIEAIVLASVSTLKPTIDHSEKTPSCPPETSSLPTEDAQSIITTIPETLSIESIHCSSSTTSSIKKHNTEQEAKLSVKDTSSICSVDSTITTTSGSSMPPSRRSERCLDETETKKGQSHVGSSNGIQIFSLLEAPEIYFLMQSVPPKFVSHIFKNCKTVEEVIAFIKTQLVKLTQKDILILFIFLFKKRQFLLYMEICNQVRSSLIPSVKPCFLLWKLIFEFGLGIKTYELHYLKGSQFIPAKHVLDDIAEAELQNQMDTKKLFGFLKVWITMGFFFDDSLQHIIPSLISRIGQGEDDKYFMEGLYIYSKCNERDTKSAFVEELQKTLPVPKTIDFNVHIYAINSIIQSNCHGLSLLESMEMCSMYKNLILNEIFLSMRFNTITFEEVIRFFSLEPNFFVIEYINHIIHQASTTHPVCFLQGLQRMISKNECLESMEHDIYSNLRMDPLDPHWKPALEAFYSYIIESNCLFKVLQILYQHAAESPVLSGLLIYLKGAIKSEHLIPSLKPYLKIVWNPLPSEESDKERKKHHMQPTIIHNPLKYCKPLFIDRPGFIKSALFTFIPVNQENLPMFIAIIYGWGSLIMKYSLWGEYFIKLFEYYNEHPSLLDEFIYVVFRLVAICEPGFDKDSLDKIFALALSLGINEKEDFLTCFKYPTERDEKLHLSEQEEDDLTSTKSNCSIRFDTHASLVEYRDSERDPSKKPSKRTLTLNKKEKVPESSKDKTDFDKDQKLRCCDPTTNIPLNDETPAWINAFVKKFQLSIDGALDIHDSQFTLLMEEFDTMKFELEYQSMFFRTISSFCTSSSKTKPSKHIFYIALFERLYTKWVKEGLLLSKVLISDILKFVTKHNLASYSKILRKTA